MKTINKIIFICLTILIVGCDNRTAAQVKLDLERQGFKVISVSDCLVEWRVIVKDDVGRVQCLTISNGKICSAR